MNTNRKKLSMITIGLMVLVFLFTVGTASAALVHLDPIALTVNPGDAVDFIVKGSGFPDGASSGAILLNWDPSILQFNSIAPQAPFSTLFEILDPGAASLDFTAGFLGPAPGVGGVEFTFANTFFTALAPPGTVVGLDVGFLGPWQDGNGQPVTDVVFQGATVTVVNPVPVPGAVWLFGSGLIGMVGLKRRRKS